MIQLRPYQHDAIARVKAAFTLGARRVCLVMPTGAGKTHTAGAIVQSALSSGNHILWLAHRAELVDQAAASLNAVGIRTNTISAGAQSLPDPHALVHVATVQTLLARNLRPRADRLILDEAHRYVADQFGALAKSYDKALTLGLTATPERGDGMGLGDLFDRLVVGAEIGELVKLGCLVHANIVRPPSLLRAGQMAQRPVDAYRKHADGQKAIVFANCVEAAAQHASEFVEAGIPAICVHGDMDPEHRAIVLAGFRRGVVRVLCNVYVLTEGFDVPDASCCILARNIGSLGTYIQMVGRVLRPAPDKQAATIVDLCGSTHMHGHPEDDVSYSLGGKGMRRTPADTQRYCEVCGGIKDEPGPCAECGHEGDRLVPNKSIGVELVKYAAKRAESREQVAATLARWAAIGRTKGYGAGWLFGKARAVYGHADWRECQRHMGVVK